MKDISNKLEDASDEWKDKVNKSEVDELRIGMEKERCKINYFQDKISNINKVVEAVKTESNSMSEYISLYHYH